MKHYIINILLIFLLSFSHFSFSNIVESKSAIKIGSNLLSLIFLGDINALYEKQFAKQFSWISTCHYIQNNDIFLDDTLDLNGTINNDADPAFRVSTGIRSYSSFNIFNFDFFNFGIKSPDTINQLNTSLIGNFIELKSALTHLNGTTYPSVEFSLGLSDRFNDTLYYEWKIGLTRLLLDSDAISSDVDTKILRVNLTGSFGIGLLF
tara:strand:- start:45 stop:665 length:621 start_codon:yes stop_codon:yes gene_type:complete